MDSISNITRADNPQYATSAEINPTGNSNGRTLYTTESPATNNSQQERCRKTQENTGNRERVPPRSLTHGHGKLKPNIQNSGGNINEEAKDRSGL
jgi:hypothetical protein